MEDRAELQLEWKSSSFISRILGCLVFLTLGQGLANYGLQVKSDLCLFLKIKFYQNTAMLVHLRIV